MNRLLLILFVFLLRSNSKTISLASSGFNLMNLSSGEYRINTKALFDCNPTPGNKLQNNFHLTRNADNSTELKGNITYLIPLDDTFFLDINIALKDDSGDWRENTFVHRSPKACSTLKTLLGDEWNAIAYGLGYNTTNCPIPAGIYELRGVKTSVLRKRNFPRTFIYGIYKIRINYSRKNEIYGCTVYIVEIKRPQ